MLLAVSCMCVNHPRISVQWSCNNNNVLTSSFVCPLSPKSVRANGRGHTVKFYAFLDKDTRYFTRDYCSCKHSDSKIS